MRLLRSRLKEANEGILRISGVGGFLGTALARYQKDAIYRGLLCRF